MVSLSPRKDSKTKLFSSPNRLRKAIPFSPPLLPFAKGMTTPIRIALARLDQAEAAAAKAGSALWPQSELNAEAARSWTRADDRSATARQYGLGLAAIYELDLSSKIGRASCRERV